MINEGPTWDEAVIEVANSMMDSNLEIPVPLPTNHQQTTEWLSRCQKVMSKTTYQLIKGEDPVFYNYPDHKQI